MWSWCYGLALGVPASVSGFELSRFFTMYVVNDVLTPDYSYIDGIDILYSTNTFHLACGALIQNLSGALLPQRVTAIRSLELLLPPKSQAQVDYMELHRLCGAMPRLFPRLNNLYFSIPGTVIKPPPPTSGDHDPVMVAAEGFLGPVEALLMQLPDDGEYTVSISTSFWKPLLWRHDALQTPGLRAELDWTGYRGRFWRRLGENREGEARGYWIRNGHCEDYGFFEVDPFIHWGITQDGPDPERRRIPRLKCPIMVYDKFPFE